MSRKPQPWWRAERGAWFVTINGKQHNLGPEKEEADRAFHVLMAKPKEPVLPDAVVGLIDEWLSNVQRHNAPKTYKWYLDFAQSFTDSIPKTLRVCDLEVHHVQKWVDSHKGWSDSTCHGAITTIKRAMRWCCEQGLIKQSPIAYMKKPAIGRREVLVPEAHYQYMLKKTRDQEFRDLLTVVWECGPRPQELTKVEAKWVHQDCWIFPREDSKGKRVQRVVYLTEAAVEICRRLCEKWPTGPIFRNTEGRPWDGTSTACRLRRFKGEKHLGIKYNLYNFRHSWINRLLKAGVDHITVSTLAGHADASMIANVYQHLAQDPEYLKKALRRGGASNAGASSSEPKAPVQTRKSRDTPESAPLKSE
jgi:integrase